MEWLYAGLAVVIVLAAVAYWRRRSRVNAGEACWQCGFDLTGCASRIDFRGDRRCPKCDERAEADEPGRVDEL
jgi:hypothetical protein